MSKEVLVIKINARNHADLRRHDVCRIEPPAKTDFKNCPLNISFPKMLKRQSGYHLKKSRMGEQFSLSQQFFNQQMYPRKRSCKFSVGDFLAVYPNSFVDFL